MGTKKRIYFTKAQKHVMAKNLRVAKRQLDELDKNRIDQRDISEKALHFRFHSADYRPGDL